MGLTIRYSLHATAADRDSARRLVRQLHQAAGDLPLQEVGDIFELSGDEIESGPTGNDVRDWLLVQSNRVVLRGERCLIVTPQELIAFSTWPGHGCEAANFGLCRYPTEIELDGALMATELEGWHWQSFCKTQYASNPQEGGVENFVRCHLSIVKLLDRARELDLLAEVTDEGGFWEHRDVAQLAQTVGQWNRTIAGLAGLFKDAYGDDLIAPITEFPDFEHLEADDRRK